MFKLFRRLITDNLKEIPLLWVTFNYKFFKKNCKDGSCLIRIHPELREDKYIINTLNELVDYIRDNYDMKKM